MDIQSSRERRIYGSATAPPDTEWLWLLQANGKSTLKDYVNGRWVTVGGATSTYTQQSPSIPLAGDYITSDALNNTLAYYVTGTSLTLTLLGYAKMPYIYGIRDTIYTLTEKVQKCVTLLQLNTILTGYQKKLSVGTGLKMDSTGIKIALDYDSSLNTSSQKPVSSAVIATKLNLVENTFNQEIQSLEASKQNKLTRDNAGTGISITLDSYGNVKINTTGTMPGGDTPLAGMLNAEVVETDDEATDSDVVYFFSRSPYRGVGLYNTLVQNGSLTYKDGNGINHTITYSERNLYRLYSDGSFDEVTPEPGDITFQDNIVYYKGARTTMRRYGELVYTHKILYASTACDAYLRFKLTGPFYEDKTDVKIVFDESYIQAHRMTKTVIGDNTVWSETVFNSGDTIEVTNENAHNGYMFRFERIFDSNENLFSDIHDPLNVAVLIIVGDENGYHMDTDIHIKYPESEIFFKLGYTFDEINDSLPNDVTKWDTSYCTLTDGSLLFDYSGAKIKHVIKTYQSLDQTKKHVFYAKVHGNNNKNGMYLEGCWDNWNGFTVSYDSQFPLSDHIYWHSENTGEGTYGNFYFAKCTMHELNHYFGNFKGGGTHKGQNVFVDPTNNPDIIPVAIRIRQRNNTKGYIYDEIGVLHYDEDTISSPDEILPTI